MVKWVSHAQIMFIGIRKVGKWKLKKEGRRIIERKKLRSNKENDTLPSSLGSFQTLAMVDFDPLLFSLSFAWLLSVSFSFSLFIFSQKSPERYLSLTTTFQALLPETSLSPSLITLVGSLTFCYHFFPYH